jgi:tetratricopeptide (TPR) repeat protein
MGSFRSFGNTNAVGMNRGLGRGGLGGVNRVNNFNNLGRTSFVANRTNLNVNRGNLAGTFGNRGFGVNRGFGPGFNRGFGPGFNRGFGPGFNRGFGPGGFNRSFGGFNNGFGGFNNGFGGFGGFGLGLLLGAGLGGFGWGGGWGGGGWGGGWGGGGWGGYGGWGYPYGGFGYGDLGYGGIGYYGPYDWLYGGSLYGYGYSPYSNPYVSIVSYSSPGVGVAAVPYDYSQPINTVSGPPAESALEAAATLFSSGRDAFKQGNFAQALQQADAALLKNPNDSSVHEFRALCLFALGRYDEAASALYAVLSVGPGWDWPTLIGLYPNIDVYTAQLRALEDYDKSNPQAASGRFVLAYQYLTEGHFDEAANMLRQVVALKPNDTLSTKLLEQLDSARQQQNPAGAPTEPPPVPGAGLGAGAGPGGGPGREAVPANTAVPEGASISGTWTAEPNAETRVALTIQPGGAFNWQVTQKGQTRQFSGSSSFGGGLLTLVPEKTPPIVGRVSWTDRGHMTFRVVGDGPDAPGLSFARQ